MQHEGRTEADSDQGRATGVDAHGRLCGSIRWGERARIQAQPEKPKEGMGRYVVVLWEPGTPIPGGNGTEHHGKIAEPDFTKLGGIVLSSVSNRRVVDLPVKEAGKLGSAKAIKVTKEGLEVAWDAVRQIVAK